MSFSPSALREGFSPARLRLPLRLIAALAVGGLLASLAARPAVSQAPPPTLVVHADQLAGKFSAEQYGNISCESIYGQVMSPLSDAAFQWLRTSNAISYVRCPTWLGDGISKRTPGSFAACRVLRPGPDGYAYQWEDLERVLDTLVAAGVKPVIVLAGLPDLLLAGEPRRNELGSPINRPQDLKKLQALLGFLFKRLQKTYGTEEIRSWYFEVWSQPDHQGSWEGGRAAPFEAELPADAIARFNNLYDVFAAAADSVDPRLRIGGPGLAGDRKFFRRFLNHCARGANTATGRKGARLDFVSWQAYGSLSETLALNEELRGIVAEFPELTGTQTLVTEGGLKPSAGALANSAIEAARMAALIDANGRAEKGVDRIFRAGDLVDDHFDGYRPLISHLGVNTVPTPAFRLLMMLAKMGSERVKADLPPGVGAIATRPNPKIARNACQVLVYRYDERPADPAKPSAPITVRVKMTGLPNTLLRLPARVYRVDSATNAPHEIWTKAGSPSPAPAELGARLVGTQYFAPTVEETGIAINGGEMSLDVTLTPNSVTLITVGAEPSYGASLSDRGRRIRNAEDDFGLAYDQARAGMVSKAIESFQKLAEKYADTAWRETALRTIAGIYELDLKSPDQAAAVRKELLTLPLDDFARLRLLERLRIDAVRKKDKRAGDDYSREIAGLEKRSAERRRWPLRRYYGE